MGFKQETGGYRTVEYREQWACLPRCTSKEQEKKNHLLPQIQLKISIFLSLTGNSSEANIQKNDSF